MYYFKNDWVFSKLDRTSYSEKKKENHTQENKKRKNKHPLSPHPPSQKPVNYLLKFTLKLVLNKQ